MSSISPSIIEKLTEDSQEAFKTFFKATYPQVWNFSKCLTKDDADAEDKDNREKESQADREQLPGEAGSRR